jgi:hypothetical protein
MAAHVATVGRILNSKILWSLGALALAGWVFFQWLYPTCTFRYRLTVEVMTPDGPKSGSSVIEVSYSSTRPIPNPGIWRSDTITGEAVYVDLGRGKNLFVTLTRAGSGRPHQNPVEGNVPPFPNQRLNKLDLAKANGAFDAKWLPIKIFDLSRAPGKERRMCAEAAKFEGAGPRPVPLSNLPTTVTFQNLADPSSVQLLDPRDLAAKFGPGYAISSTTLEWTSDKVTRSIRTRLPWLSEHPEPSLVPLPNPQLPEIVRKLRFGHFVLDQPSHFSF